MDRILYLMARYPLWSESFLRQDLSGLLNNGVIVNAVALWRGDCQTEPEWPAVHYLSGEAGDFAKSGRSGLPIWVPRQLRMRLSLLRHRRELRQVVEYCRKECITHIHGEVADIAGLLAAKAAEELHCSYSIGIHADDCANMKYPPEALFENASFITVCNEAARLRFIEQAPQYAERLHLLHHGVNLQFWRYAERRAECGSLKLLFAGRLVAKKGVPLLLEALLLLPDNTHLTIAGDGAEMEHLQQLATRLGVQNRISWLGAVKQSELKELFHQASCLCIPSIESVKGRMDGIPNIMLEAMAAGLPVVGFLSGSIGEVLSSATGWVAETLTAAALSDVLLAMHADAQAAEVRRLAARQLIEAEYDVSRIVKSRAELFQKS